jgi:hypothetical protein
MDVNFSSLAFKDNPLPAQKDPLVEDKQLLYPDQAKNFKISSIGKGRNNGPDILVMDTVVADSFIPYFQINKWAEAGTLEFIIAFRKIKRMALEQYLQACHFVDPLPPLVSGFQGKSFHLTFRHKDDITKMLTITIQNNKFAPEDISTIEKFSQLNLSIKTA